MRAAYPGAKRAALLIAAALLCHAGAAFGSLSAEKGALQRSAALEYERFVRALGSMREAVLANKSSSDAERRQKPASASRLTAPVVAVTAPGPGQAGYVHYFLLRLPDKTLEVQVGIETHDQRIAWSFPEFGVVVSPFMEAGSIEVAGKEYEVAHLYGLRPFPDEAAFSALQRALPERVRRMTARNIPYCDNDGPDSRCMSCLGFVMRILFPGRDDAYPDVPRDFQRAVTGERYTTHDLLLYLTGMYELPSRDARLRRITRLTVSEQLRQDLSVLVRATRTAEGTRNNQRKRL